MAAVAHRAAEPVHAGAAAPAAAPAPAAPAHPQSTLVVPDMVEDRRKDEYGNIVTRRYYRAELLGKGGFAKCFAFHNSDRTRVIAGKCISKESLLKSKAKQKVGCRAWGAV